ncbi:hypothetical protein HOY80DRAFT_348282 [Tuber brumale]|nr:hypothetical protein HOY80DRAFT_348282 [Tuber brumale]
MRNWTGRSRSAEAHLLGSTVSTDCIWGEITEILGRRSSGTKAKIVWLYGGGKNEINVPCKKAVLGPRKVLCAAQRTAMSARYVAGRCLPACLLACLSALHTVLGSTLLCCLDHTLPVPYRYSACLRERTQTSADYNRCRKSEGKKEGKQDPIPTTRYGVFPRSLALPSLALARGMNRELAPVCRSIGRKTRSKDS